MTGRQDRPQLQTPDLLLPARPQGGSPPRATANDPRFDAAAKLETHDAFVRGVQDGRVRVVNPETAPPRPQPPEQVPLRRRPPEASLSTGSLNT